MTELRNNKLEINIAIHSQHFLSLKSSLFILNSYSEFFVNGTIVEGVVDHMTRILISLSIAIISNFSKVAKKDSMEARKISISCWVSQSFS